MKDPSEWAKADLNDLVQNDVQEDLHLDYKQSRALARTDECRTELSKDVAAFANSDGGRIIYGIAERGHHPENVDNGVDATELSREWLEQVISSNIQPKIDGLRIYPIPLPAKGSDRVAYIIDIPQSKSRAPHQSRDRRYYKRYNFQSVPMEDYEIRDVFRRASTPDLWINFRFDSGVSTKIGLQSNANVTESIRLYADIGNNASTPAEYAIIELYIDTFFERLFVDNVLRHTKNIMRDGREFAVLMRTWSAPNQLPIFAETVMSVTEFMNLAIPKNLIGTGFDFRLGYSIRAPGCSTEKFTRVILQGRTLWIPDQGNQDS
jgi:hypothetical protein